MATTDTYTSNDTWVCPAGVFTVSVECWGGGGSGGDGEGASGGEGGGGGAYSEKVNIVVTPTTGYTVVVGGGEAHDANGGDSYFNTTGTVLAKGGTGGDGYLTAGPGGAAGSGEGDTKYSGGNGSSNEVARGGGGGGGAGDAANGGNASGVGDGSAGAGGTANGGNGGDGGHNSAETGDAGSVRGGGGGGGFAPEDGGAGGRGEVRVTYTVASAPTVTTQAVTAIAGSTATGNGNVTSDGGATITERGVCWAVTENPTTADDKATKAGTTGAFTAAITGLSAGVKYHCRAYAINAIGTSYGADVEFTTPSPTAFLNLLVGYKNN